MEFILELLAEGWSHEQILHNYPQLTADDILAAIHYAAEILKVERIYSVPVVKKGPSQLCINSEVQDFRVTSE